MPFVMAKLFHAPGRVQNVQVAAGFRLSCGVREDGSVDCWGCMNDSPNSCTWGKNAISLEEIADSSK